MDDTQRELSDAHWRSPAAIGNEQKSLSFLVREMRSAKRPIRSPWPNAFRGQWKSQLTKVPNGSVAVLIQWGACQRARFYSDIRRGGKFPTCWRTRQVGNLPLQCSGMASRVCTMN